MFVQQLLLDLLLFLGGLLLIIFFIWVARRPPNRPPRLKEYYQRLGQTSPDEPCPCGRGGSTPRPYRDCCRPRDVQDLSEEVRKFLWKYCSHHSFAGRRRSRSMQTRLEDFPLPRLVLPDWVEAPEKHTFPISREALYSWTPLKVQRLPRPEGVPEDTGPGDLF